MITSFNSWYQQNHQRLSGGGVWLHGAEINTVPLSEWDSRPYRVLIARLSTYRDTADSFTHKLLYQGLADSADIYPDCAWLPPPKDIAHFDVSSVPWLLGTTTKYGPRNFDCVALSNSIVQELVNLPHMLKKSGVPLSKVERMSDPSCPLILLGGSNALYSSVYWMPDPPVDGIFIGGSMTIIKQLFKICSDAKKRGCSKQEIVNELKSIPGFFEPENPGATRMMMPDPAQSNQNPVRVPVAFDEDVMGRGSIPISQGCPCFCGFCSESWLSKPYLQIPPSTVQAISESAKKEQGLERCELYSFNFNVHDDFLLLVKNLVPVFDVIGLKSQRFDYLAHTPVLPKILHALGKSSITCGLEGISARIRRYLHKNLEDKDLQNALFYLFSNPLRELKVFLVITGHEADVDLAEFKELCRSIRDMLAAADRKPRVVFSATPLVCFPWTPLEFADAPSMQKMTKISNQIQTIVIVNKFEYREAMTTFEWWVSQVLVRAADPRIGQALLAAVEQTGIIYYEKIHPLFVEAFQKNISELGLGPVTLLHAHPAENPGPWQLLDTGVSRGFLHKQFLLSQKFQQTPPCTPTLDFNGECSGCMACTTPEQVHNVTRCKEPAEVDIKELSTSIAFEKTNVQMLHFKVRIHESARGLARKYCAVAMARACMKADPEMVHYYKRTGQSWWEKLTGYLWAHGDDIVSLGFTSAGADYVRTRSSNPEFIALVNTYCAPWLECVGLTSSIPLTFTIEIVSEYPFTPQKYFSANRIPYVQRRISENSYRFDFAPAALKRKIMTACTIVKSDTSVKLIITPGEKFNVAEFIKQAFAYNDECEWMRVKVSVNIVE